jgi:hypothetical protein
MTLLAGVEGKLATDTSEKGSSRTRPSAPDANMAA